MTFWSDFCVNKMILSWLIIKIFKATFKASQLSLSRFSITHLIRAFTTCHYNVEKQALIRQRCDGGLNVCKLRAIFSIIGAKEQKFFMLKIILSPYKRDEKLNLFSCLPTHPPKLFSMEERDTHIQRWV